MQMFNQKLLSMLNDTPARICGANWCCSTPSSAALRKDDTSGNLPFHCVRWVGGGTAKEKAGREQRRGEGAVEVEEKTIVRGGLKGWWVEVGVTIENNIFRLISDERLCIFLFFFSGSCSTPGKKKIYYKHLHL